MTAGRRALRFAARFAAPGAAPFAMLLAACGDSGAGEAHWIDELMEDTAGQARAAEGGEVQLAQADAADDGGFDINALIEEVESSQAAEPVIPNGASVWNEMPMPDGVFADHSAGQSFAYRHDVIEIPVPANGGALEYKLQMNAGDSIVYSWTAEGLSDPALLLAEFHGHTERVGDEQGDLMFYRRETGGAESGALLNAPYTGIHGWYLENNSDADITVVLDVAGFYEIVEGQAGVIR